MDKVQIAPFGSLERFQRPRRLGKKEPNLHSSLITRWETISPEFEPILQATPLLKDRVREAVQQRDKEISLSRGEYDQLPGFLDKLNEAWSAYLDLAGPSLKDRIVTWQRSSRRGFFRLLLLLILLVLEDTHEREGKKLDAKGLGGMIKSMLESISKGAIEAKAGSLYVALEDFEQDELIVNYKTIIEKNAPVFVTDRGYAFIFEALKVMKSYLALLDNAGIFASARQDNLDGAKGVNEMLLGKKFSTMDIGEISNDITSLASLIKSLEESSRFSAAKNENVKELIANWQDNLNRGIIDVYILGKFFVGPCYGNALIAEAEASLDFQAGTLYPKIKDLVNKGFIIKVTDDEQIAILSKATPKKQGPQKSFYDITTLGALYFMSIFAMFMVDLNVLFNLSLELLERVNPPLQDS
ncbi:MAG TPA: hypothetical protein VKM55_10765 [Candidatus Lokiarchaeia archaeon]|nr:hypothetical protein [Candidatus Lokiarchaeia archaeon]